MLITFVVSVLAIFPLFLLLAAFNSSSGRKAIHSVIRYWSIVWLSLIGMPVTTKGRKPRDGRHIIVANHISYLDTLVIFPAVKAYFRPLGKKEIIKIPVVGFIYRQIVILVDRSRQESRTKSMRLMWRILRHEADILIFPEGTFNETSEPMKDFYNGAFRLAIVTQVPILPVILPDTVHRWHYSGWWKLWPGRNRAVFLPEVSVTGMTIDHLPELKEKVYKLMADELAKYSKA